MGNLFLNEKIYMVILTMFIIFVFIKSIVSKNKIDVFSPMVFISIIYLMYTVIGPLVFLNFEMDVFPGGFTRQFYEPAWLASMISLFSIYFGYSIYLKKRQPIRNYSLSYSKMFMIAIGINLMGLFLYGIVNPGRLIAQLNPLSVSHFHETSEAGGFINYLNSAINFLIVGNSLLLLSIKRISLFNKRFWVFIFFLLITFSIYSSLGFRYRLLLLFVSLFVSYYLKKGTRPSFILAGIIVPLFIAVMGIIGLTRSYGSGLDLSALENSGNQNAIVSGFRETNVFPISGAVIKAVPERVDFVYTEIIRNAILFPIPRKFILNKDTDSYIRNPIKAYKPFREIGAQTWAAMLFFAEWYAAFGWFGLIGISIFLGIFYRRLWERVNINIQNEYFIVEYAIYLSFLYLIITRSTLR